MINMSDIYYKVDSYIVKNGYWEKDNIEKQELIEEGLTLYLTEKIMSLPFYISNNETIKKVNNGESVELDELVDALGKIIPESSHFDTIRHLTHYVLGIAGDLQGHSIVWYHEPEKDISDTPVITYDNAGRWDSITTTKSIMLPETFKAVYKELNHQLENTKGKQLSIGQRTLL